MATTIPKTSFWAQRLQAVESTSDIPGFFDKTPAPSSATSASPISTMAPVSMQNETEGLGQTATVVAANPVDLQVAALMHHLSADTIVCAAWAVLLRSYAGEDGVFNFGVCLDRDRAAWLSTMTVSGDEPLLSALRAAEQDKKLTLGHALAFESLGAFTKSTGYESIATAVYVHAGKPKFSDMHSPVSILPVGHETDGVCYSAILRLTNLSSPCQLSWSISPKGQWLKFTSTFARTCSRAIALRASLTTTAMFFAP